MRKRILFKNDKGHPIDAIMEIVPLQTLLVKYLEDERMVRIDVDNIVMWEDAPTKIKDDE
jgi:hypothetical protein